MLLYFFPNMSFCTCDGRSIVHTTVHTLGTTAMAANHTLNESTSLLPASCCFAVICILYIYYFFYAIDALAAYLSGLHTMLCDRCAVTWDGLAYDADGSDIISRCLAACQVRCSHPLLFTFRWLPWNISFSLEERQILSRY